MRIRAIVIRILRQFRRDKRTLALLFIAPIFVLSLMYLVFNGDAYTPKMGIVAPAGPIVQQLEKHDAKVYTYDTLDAAREALDRRDIDALLNFSDQQIHLLLEGSDPTASKAVMGVLQQMQGAPISNMKPDIAYLHGSDKMTAIDHFGPIMIGFFVFFFVFLIAGVSFLRERTTGTLERLLATPLKRWEIVAGYVVGFGIFTIVQALLISWYSIQVLGILMTGSFWYVMLITLLLSMTALTLGTLLSAFAGNELQMIQFIPLIIVPQMFLSGIFPMNTLPDWLQKLGLVMPLTYGANALTDVMIRGKGWGSIAVDVYVLIGFSLLFMILNVRALRKHRKM